MEEEKQGCLFNCYTEEEAKERADRMYWWGCVVGSTGTILVGFLFWIGLILI